MCVRVCERERERMKVSLSEGQTNIKEDEDRTCSPLKVKLQLLDALDALLLRSVSTTLPIALTTEQLQGWREKEVSR